MNTQTKEEFIRQKAHQNQQNPQGAKVVWSQHAIAELVADDLARRQVEQALSACEVIEDYPVLGCPLPDCLVLGWLSSGESLHAVIAIDAERDRILVVTVYLPSEEEWEHDWRTRKR
jgi:hypothetical protein